MKWYFGLLCALVCGYIVGNQRLEYGKLIELAQSKWGESPTEIVDQIHIEISEESEEDCRNVNTTENEVLLAFQTRDRVERRQKVRKDQLNKVCSEICSQKKEAASCVNLKLLQLDRIIVDDQHKVLFHLIAKSGATSWKRALALASGKVTEEDIQRLTTKFGEGNDDVRPSSFVHNMPVYLKMTGLRYMSSYTEIEIRHRLRSYFKFAFVRDPLDRLLASFRAKILVRDPFNVRVYIPLAGVYIYEHYRHMPENNPHKMNYTFAEYLHYLADMMEQNKPLDRHWNRLTVIRPCLVNYDFIGHLDTFDEDAAYILHHIMGTNLNVSAALDRNKSPHGGRTHGQETGDVVRQYYSQVPPGILRKICKAVDVDSRMFGFGSKIGWTP